MPLFLDACALAKRYLREGASTERMKDITGRFDRWGGFVVSAFIEPECISALAKYARNQTNSELRAHLFSRHAALVETFRRELSGPAFTIVDVKADFVDRAARLLKHHPEYNIGAGDAVHLVTALDVFPNLGRPLVFVTADAGLEKAARNEGLQTMNPLREDVRALESIPGLDPPAT